MSGLTFLQTLKAEVARMQLAHPEREGELARAHALILHGMVVPSPDDPATGQVLSSDGHKVYHVNGTCDCDAGQHGRGCKHVHGWRLYQYVERKMVAQQPQEPAEELRGGVAHPLPNSDAPQGLGEAPASANVRVTIGGREVQITLRASDESRLLERLQVVLEQFPVEQKPQPQASEQLSPQQHNALAMGRKITGVCPVHGVQMKLNNKNGKQWWSHRTADGWCKGR
jgi:hypothetical protein